MSHENGVARSNGAGHAQAAGEPLLEVRDLHVEFETGGEILRAVNGLTYDLHAGERLAIIGESGSGKTVSSEVVMGILDSPPGRVTKGIVRYRGQDLLPMAPKDRRKLCGSDIAMIFQDPLTALNPGLTIGQQIGELFTVHRRMPRSEARSRSIELLGRVGIPSPRSRVDDYPMAFSGGMRQRVVIAMALALDPSVIIADEPTTALDVTVQAQIVELLTDICRERGTALILITHDLGLAAEIASRVVVMYAGSVAEGGPIREVFAKTSHPYTKALLRSVPRVDAKQERIMSIGGRPPDMRNIPTGCPFHPRCAYAVDRCVEEVPTLRQVDPSHASACHRFEEVLRDG